MILLALGFNSVEGIKVELKGCGDSASKGYYACVCNSDGRNFDQAACTGGKKAGSDQSSSDESSSDQSRVIKAVVMKAGSKG